MKIPRVQKCFWFGLRKGGFAIGWIGFAESIILFIASMYELHSRGKQKPDFTLFMMIISSLISIMAYVTLLIGTKKGNPVLFIPVLVEQASLIISAALVIIIVSVTTKSISFAVFTIIVGIVFEAIQIYFMVCIFSLYCLLKLEPENSVPDTPVIRLGRRRYRSDSPTGIFEEVSQPV